MIEDLREKLKSEVETADWNMLKPHHEKETVFIVSGDLGLLDVAVAVATDKAHMIKVWLESGQLSKPSKHHEEEFGKNEFKKICDFIIIQPYVLIQLNHFGS